MRTTDNREQDFRDTQDAWNNSTFVPVAEQGAQRCEQWLQENRESIRRYNERVIAHGTFGDKERCF